MHRRSRGFTLIELVIAIAVIGILSAVAVPGYRQHMIKTRRTEAQSVLMEAAGFMERKFTELNCYNWDKNNTPWSCNKADPDIASQGYGRSPKTGTAMYNITASAPTSTSFTITATPVSGGPQATDGRLAINQAGQKFWDQNNNGSYATDENTWEKK